MIAGPINCTCTRFCNIAVVKYMCSNNKCSGGYNKQKRRVRENDKLVYCKQDHPQAEKGNGPDTGMFFITSP